MQLRSFLSLWQGLYCAFASIELMEDLRNVVPEQGFSAKDNLHKSCRSIWKSNTRRALARLKPPSFWVSPTDKAAAVVMLPNQFSIDEGMLYALADQSLRQQQGTRRFVMHELLRQWLSMSNAM